MAQQIPPEQNVNPSAMDLVRHLGIDAKRLISDETELAKLELSQSVHRAGHGAIWLGAAFGTTIVALVALTIFLVAAIGRAVNGHYWVGALVTAVIELGVGYLLIKRGLKAFKGAPYSLPETRAGLKVMTSAS